MQFKLSIGNDEIVESYSGVSELRYVLDEQAFLYHVIDEDVSISAHFFQIARVDNHQNSHDLVFKTLGANYAPFKKFVQECAKNDFNIIIYLLYQLLNIIEEKKLIYGYLKHENILVDVHNYSIKLVKMHSAKLLKSDYTTLHVPDLDPLCSNIKNEIDSLLHVSKLHYNDIYMICQIFNEVTMSDSDFKDTIVEILKYNTQPQLSERFEAAAIISCFKSNPDVLIPIINIPYKKHKIHEKICNILGINKINIKSIGYNDAIEFVSTENQSLLFKIQRTEKIASRALKKMSYIKEFCPKLAISKLTVDYKVINIYWGIKTPICLCKNVLNEQNSALMKSMKHIALYFRNNGNYHSTLNPYTILLTDNENQLPFVEAEHFKIVPKQQKLLFMDKFSSNDIFTPPELDPLRKGLPYIYIKKNKALIYQICLSYLICLVCFNNKVEDAITKIKIELQNGRQLDDYISNIMPKWVHKNIKTILIKAINADFNERPSLKKLIEAINPLY